MEAESAASGSRRDVHPRDVRRPTRVSRFPRVFVEGTIYKPGEYALVHDPKKAEEITAAYRKIHLTAESMMPFPHKLAKVQIELERKGESHLMRLAPALQKQVDEARQAMNHPPATDDLIETLVENLNLEASPSTGIPPNT